MIRITGMNSGLDTETIINELASARSMKVQKVEKEQTKLSWKIDAWKELNTKIYALYTDVLSDMRFDYAYSKKTTTISNPNAVSVVTGGEAVNGTQNLKISQLAKSSYLTGGAITSKAASFTGSKITDVREHVTGGKIVAETGLNGNRISGATEGTETMKALGILKEGESSKFTLTVAGTSHEITVGAGTTLESVRSQLQDAGVTAIFADGHFTITEATKGANSFSISKVDGDSLSASLINKLGLDAKQTITELASKGSTKLSDLGFNALTTIKLKIDGTEQSITLYDSNDSNDVDLTLAGAAEKLNGVAGIYAAFDEASGRFVVSAEETGKKLELSDGGTKVLEKLGLASTPEDKLVGNTTLAALGVTGPMELKYKVGKAGTEVEKSITLQAYQTLDEVADLISNATDSGINAHFDANMGQFTFSAKKIGETFTFDAVSSSLLGKLGLNNVTGKAASAGTIKDGTTKLSELGFGSDDKEIKFKLTIGGKAEEVTLKGSQTLDDVATMLRGKGLNAKFDAGTGRFFISAKDSGTANAFTIEAGAIMGEDEDKKPIWGDPSGESLTALKNLGLYYDPSNLMNTGKVEGQATMIGAQDAKIELNGVEFTSSKNTFEINSLTLTVTQETKENETITLTTQQDTEGIYNTIKNFFKKYNELINEMDKLYNAKSASKYQPLTKEEKDAMSDSEVEEWEKKIKDSLLRRDSTLFSVSEVMKKAMMNTFLPGMADKNNGKDIYLTYFGINTLDYFKAKDNEKGAYHIDGDADDTNVKNKEDKLKKAIANDPDTVVEFFKKLASNLYTELDGKMARTEYSSAFTVYNDKQMDTELKKYESKITAEQKKLNDYVDRWYSKFSKMEVAMAKLQSKESSLSGLFSG